MHNKCYRYTYRVVPKNWHIFHMSMTQFGIGCVLCLFYLVFFLDLSSFIELLIFCVVWPRKTYSRDIFFFEWVYRPDWRVIFCNMVYRMYSKHVTLSTFSGLFHFFNCIILFKGTIYRVAQKSKPPPIFQKIVLKIANEIRFIHKVKVWIKHYNKIRW